MCFILILWHSDAKVYRLYNQDKFFAKFFNGRSGTGYTIVNWDPCLCHCQRGHNYRLVNHQHVWTYSFGEFGVLHALHHFKWWMMCIPYSFLTVLLSRRTLLKYSAVWPLSAYSIFLPHWPLMLASRMRQAWCELYVSHDTLILFAIVA